MNGHYSGPAAFMGSSVGHWHPFQGWDESWETSREFQLGKDVHLFASLLAADIAEKVEE